MNSDFGEMAWEHFDDNMPKRFWRLVLNRPTPTKNPRYIRCVYSFLDKEDAHQYAAKKEADGAIVSGIYEYKLQEAGR